MTLSGLTEGNRYAAIARMVESGQLPAPTSVPDATALLDGTTQGARASSIGVLSKVLKRDLSGAELSTLLGPPMLLSEGNRYAAIAELARARLFGPSIGADAAQALAGATEGARASAIGVLAPWLRADMRAADIAGLLGAAKELSEGNRYAAIASLAGAKRIPRGLSGIEAVPILDGTTQGARASAIGELATSFKQDLSGNDTRAALGTSLQLSEGNRFAAITSLARAGRFGPTIGGDAGLALEGTTQGARASSISELSPFLSATMRGDDLAVVLGEGTALSEGNRYSAIASLARANRIQRGLSVGQATAILAGTTDGARASSIAVLAPFLASGVTGESADAILGRLGELKEGNRYAAIAAIAAAGKFKIPLSGAELALVFRDMSPGVRVAAISVMGPAVAPGASVAGIPPLVSISPTGSAAPPTVASGSPSPSGNPAGASGGGASGTLAGAVAQAIGTPPQCEIYSGDERVFCDLLVTAGKPLVAKGIDVAVDAAVESGMLAVFRHLPRSLQHDLFSGKFLGTQFVSAAYQKTIDKIVSQPSALDFFKAQFLGLFCDFVKDTVDAAIADRYANRSPWEFAAVQFLSDQVYVAVYVALDTTTLPRVTTSPEAILLDAVLTEASISAQRIASIAQNIAALDIDRMNTVASWSATLGKAAVTSTMIDAGLLPARSRFVGFTPDNALAVVRTAVAGSDIPRFDEVARIVLEAQVARLKSGGAPTPTTVAKVGAAEALAGQLDKDRPLSDTLWITTFGSYTATLNNLEKLLALK